MLPFGIFFDMALGISIDTQALIQKKDHYRMDDDVTERLLFFSCFFQFLRLIFGGPGPPNEPKNPKNSRYRTTLVFHDLGSKGSIRHVVTTLGLSVLSVGYKLSFSTTVRYLTQLVMSSAHCPFMSAHCPFALLRSPTRVLRLLYSLLVSHQ